MFFTCFGKQIFIPSQVISPRYYLRYCFWCPVCCDRLIARSDGERFDRVKVSKRYFPCRSLLSRNRSLSDSWIVFCYAIGIAISAIYIGLGTVLFSNKKS